MKKPALGALPAITNDIAVPRPVRANNRFRVALDSNRYSVPAQYAGKSLTLKAYPDRLCIYDGEKLIARH